MRRGDVYWVRLDPTEGVEIRKTRPAIIVSNDRANRHLESVTVVPLTSSVRRVSPSQALVEIEGVPGKAMIDQIRSVAKQRIVGTRIGRLTPAAMAEVEMAMRTHLAL
ncbi:MAG: type II toxin-antitoxin system PemK/MazF family toxin [Proteobacteria bacterium]|nr:type II toxin-antitoxin system PemK/MazF family toxin [Pseudomonadota bacterium]